MADSQLSLLLQTLARVAVSVELEPTLQILLDSLGNLSSSTPAVFSFANLARMPCAPVRSAGSLSTCTAPTPKGSLGVSCKRGNRNSCPIHDRTFVCVRPA
jgi:hypothetical protein